MDFDSIIQSQPGEATQRVGVEFNDDGEPTAGFIIVGKDSKQYRECAQRLRTASIKRQALKSQRIDTKTDDGALQMDNLMQKNEAELAVAVTVGWFGFTSGGQDVPFSVEGLRKVFEAKPTWREKVSAAMENEQAFLTSSPTNSASSAGNTSV